MKAVWKLTGNEKMLLWLSESKLGVPILWTRFSVMIWPWFVSAIV